MKKQRLFFLVLFLVSLFLTGCYTHPLTDREQEIKTFGFDFREYAEKGFLFTPNEYLGEHYVLGIIRAELHPAIKYKRGQYQKEYGFEVYRVSAGNNEAVQMVEVVDENELIKHIYNMVIEWGGDGFSEFKLTYSEDKTDLLPGTTYSFPVISGVVIKRN